MTTTSPKLLTAADLLRLHGKGVRGELIRGVLHETRSAGLKHGEIVMLLGARMVMYVQPARLGRVFGSDTVREPDVAYVSAARLPLDIEVSGYCPVVPDLVVEVVSPSDDEVDVDNKAIMWLYYGARMALVINPEPQTIKVRRAGAPTAILTIDDTLDGADVLPGFTCPVRDILER